MVCVDNVSFWYNKKEPIFENLNLELLAGNIYGLLGRNGAGKSTLLKILSGLLIPKEGKVMVSGYSTRERSPEFLKEIYVVTEDFFLPKLTAQRFLNLYSPFYPRFNSDLFQTYLQEFQLNCNQKLSNLSYGQKKKFLLSFGLATDSKLLILDEPTNGLDIPSKSQFRKVVASAIHEDRSFIISTHQVRDIENLIDPIIILDEGTIAFNHNIESISKKIAVTREKEINNKAIIYAESDFGGYTVLKESTGKEETKMNLEILFNAVIENKVGINKIFNN